VVYGRNQAAGETRFGAFMAYFMGLCSRSNDGNTAPHCGRVGKQVMVMTQFPTF